MYNNIVVIELYQVLKYKSTSNEHSSKLILILWYGSWKYSDSWILVWKYYISNI